MKKYSNEFKVGLFVILCVAIFFYLIYSTGKLNIKKEGYHIYAVFDDIAGLGKKAPVMLNGIEVGKVEGMKITYDNDKTKIVLKLWLNKEAKVRDNAAVSIKTLGLMGEKYIQIFSVEGGGFIAAETVLAGNPYLDLDSLMSQADGIARNVTVMTDELKKLAGNLNYTAEGNKDKISQIVANLETTSKNFAEFSDDIKKHPWKLLIKQKETKAK
jgi:phospholipid/cholesterol/gamma-HCH transport system substrate-binding protein